MEVFANNAAVTLSAPITDSDLSAQVTNDGVLPVPSDGSSFRLTLYDATYLEIIKVTARSGSLLTIQRGQEGTIARAWASGTKAQLRLTKAGLDNMGQLDKAQTWTGVQTFGAPAVMQPGTAVNNPPTINQIQQGSTIFADTTWPAGGGGVGTTYVATLTPAPTSLGKGFTITIKAHDTNTGAATLNVNNLGPVTMKTKAGVDVSPGDIIAGQMYQLVHDGGSPAAFNVFGTNAVPDGAITTVKLANVSVTQAKLAAASVGQAQLKTATASGSQSGTGGAYTLAGGSYSWWTAGCNNSAGGTTGFGGSDTAAGVIGWSLFDGAASGTATFYVDERYIQASPPYDLGDGHVPLFVFALLDKSGEIKGTWVAADPPWANNGPTCIRPDYTIDGVGYQRRKKPACCIKDLGGDIDAICAHLEALANAPEVEVEVTTDFKNSDMPLIPHPFGQVGDGHTVVLLDPVHDFAHRLAELSQVEHARTVRDLLLGRHIKIDNTALERASPPGVIVVSGRLR